MYRQAFFGHPGSIPTDKSYFPFLYRRCPEIYRSPEDKRLFTKLRTDHSCPAKGITYEICTGYRRFKRDWKGYFPEISGPGLLCGGQLQGQLGGSNQKPRIDKTAKSQRRDI